jgi:hypothetical protein
MSRRPTGLLGVYGFVFFGVIVSLLAHAQSGPMQDPNHETRTPDVPGLTAATSKCGISEDGTLGSKDNPIKVGGGALYLASREVKYLSALRGPAGEGVHFKRQGSTRAADGATILDDYFVEYTGIDKPIHLYIDGYHWLQPLAPKGWLCGADMNLAPPGPDPFETQDQLNAMAVKMADQPVMPISADPDGSRTHGVVFDHMRLITLAARAAIASNKTLDSKSLGELGRAKTVVVAFPRTCEGKMVMADAIALADQQGNQPKLVDTAKGNKVASMLPGFEAPANSIAFAFETKGLIEGSRIAIRYEDACGAEGKEVLMPVRFERGKVTKSAPGVAPADVQVPAAGAQVRVQVILDADGVPQYPAYAGGPYELHDAAITAAKEWRLDAPTMNGAPILQTLTLTIVVRPPR